MVPLDRLLHPYTRKVRAIMAPVDTTPTDVGTLTLADRCDVCGAQAFVSVTFASGPLLFCGHHFAVNEPAIVASALTVTDERSTINP
jgi:hypothetical protein